MDWERFKVLLLINNNCTWNTNISKDILRALTSKITSWCYYWWSCISVFFLHLVFIWRVKLSVRSKESSHFGHLWSFTPKCTEEWWSFNKDRRIKTFLQNLQTWLTIMTRNISRLRLELLGYLFDSKLPRWGWFCPK